MSWYTLIHCFLSSWTRNKPATCCFFGTTSCFWNTVSGRPTNMFFTECGSNWIFQQGWELDEITVLKCRIGSCLWRGGLPLWDTALPPTIFSSGSPTCYSPATAELPDWSHLWKENLGDRIMPLSVFGNLAWGSDNELCTKFTSVKTSLSDKSNELHISLVIL